MRTCIVYLVPGSTKFIEQEKAWGPGNVWKSVGIFRILRGVWPSLGQGEISMPTGKVFVLCGTDISLARLGVQSHGKSI